jgi:glycosyltransferase involved in cell wall biosynthesis
MSRISVIMPAFNNGPFILEAIASVLTQTRQPDEIIVVDDGSTDGTENIVRTLTDARITFIRQENSGVSVARNRGLEIATGEFIAFLDADDRWRPQMLEQQLALMLADPSLVCCFGNFVRFVSQTGEVLPPQFTFYPEVASVATTALPQTRGVRVDHNAFEVLLAWGEWPAYTQTMLFRSDLIRGLRFNPTLRRCQDADYVLRTFLRGTVAFTPDLVADIRRHGNNATADVGLMVLDKLRALECVQEDPMTRPHRHALERRLGQARFDAAVALAGRARYREALTFWKSAIRSSGSPIRKLKRTLRVGLTALESFGQTAH